MNDPHDKMRPRGLARKRALLTDRSGALLTESQVCELLQLSCDKFSSHLAAGDLFGCEFDEVVVYPSVQFQDGRLDPAVVPLGQLMRYQSPLARVRYLLGTLPVGDADGRFKERISVLDLLRQGHTRYVFDEARLMYDIRD